ncbi:MAG: hypothetical protein GOU99_01645 [Candidatus Altiarchaeota archaeon]|nr:hypothetical protein [Candidatus Altiarchaeota archaeon]
MKLYKLKPGMIDKAPDETIVLKFPDRTITIGFTGDTVFVEELTKKKRAHFVGEQAEPELDKIMKTVNKNLSKIINVRSGDNK